MVSLTTSEDGAHRRAITVGVATALYRGDDALLEVLFNNLLVQYRYSSG